MRLGDHSKEAIRWQAVVKGFVFFVPTLPGRALSPNGAHGGWQPVAAARDQLRADVSIAIQALGPALPSYERARVSVEMRLTRKRPRDGFYRARDVGNMVSAIKPLYDAIVDMGIVPDDDAAHLDFGEHRIRRVEKLLEEGIGVLVEELGPEEKADGDPASKNTQSRLLPDSSET